MQSLTASLRQGQLQHSCVPERSGPGLILRNACGRGCACVLQAACSFERVWTGASASECVSMVLNSLDHAAGFLGAWLQKKPASEGCNKSQRRHGYVNEESNIHLARLIFVGRAAMESAFFIRTAHFFPALESTKFFGPVTHP